MVHHTWVQNAIVRQWLKKPRIFCFRWHSIVRRFAFNIPWFPIPISTVLGCSVLKKTHGVWRTRLPTGTKFSTPWIALFIFSQSDEKSRNSLVNRQNVFTLAFTTSCVCFRFLKAAQWVPFQSDSCRLNVNLFLLIWKIAKIKDQMWVTTSNFEMYCFFLSSSSKGLEKTQTEGGFSFKVENVFLFVWKLHFRF